MKHDGRLSLWLAGLAICVPIVVAVEVALGRAGPRMLTGGLLVPSTLAAVALWHAGRLLAHGVLVPTRERRTIRLAQLLGWISAALLPPVLPVLWLLTHAPSDDEPERAPALSSDPRPFRRACEAGGAAILAVIAGFVFSARLEPDSVLRPLLLVGIFVATLATLGCVHALRQGEERLGESDTPILRPWAWIAFLAAFLSLGASTAVYLVPWILRVSGLTPR